MTTKTDSLIIESVAEGGFLIREVPLPGCYSSVLRACTTIDEALAFIRNKLGTRRPTMTTVPGTLVTEFGRQV